MVADTMVAYKAGATAGIASIFSQYGDHYPFVQLFKMTLDRNAITFTSKSISPTIQTNPTNS